MKPSLADISWAVCTKYQVFPTQLRGKTKGCKNVYRPRMLAMYLAREFTGQSYPKIGRWFNRDHTTAMNACRRIREISAKDSSLKAHIEELSLVLPKMAQVRHSATTDSVQRLLAGEVSWRVNPNWLPPARF